LSQFRKGSHEVKHVLFSPVPGCALPFGLYCGPAYLYRATDVLLVDEHGVGRLADDKGQVRDGFELGSPAAAVLYSAELDAVVAVSTAAVLCSFKFTSAGIAQEQKVWSLCGNYLFLYKKQLRMAGNNIVAATFIGPALLATIANENIVRR